MSTHRFFCLLTTCFLFFVGARLSAANPLFIVTNSANDTLFMVADDAITLRAKLIINDSGDTIGIVGADNIFFNLGQPTGARTTPSRSFIIAGGGEGARSTFGQNEYFIVSPDSTGFNDTAFDEQILWVPTKGALIAGKVIANDDSIGQNSMTFGFKCIAKGNHSLAIGNQTRAYGANSTAMGNQCVASGNSSMAMGFQSEANGHNSIAMGYICRSDSGRSVAMGQETTASGEVAVALGMRVTASGNYSVALGRNASTNGKGGAFVYGDRSTASTTNDTLFATLLDQFNVRAAGGYRFFASSDIAAAKGVFIAPDGNMGLGTDNPSAFKLQAAGSIGPETDALYDLGSSSQRWQNVYAANGTIQTSDGRLKTDVRELEYGLDDVMRLRPVSYTWKDRPFDNAQDKPAGRKLGLIGQEVQDVIAEVVKAGNDADHTLGLYYSDLIPVLIKAIQEQQGQIEQLRTELQEVKRQER